MSDYTPTTERIRAMYVFDRADGVTLSEAEAGADFDRWIAQHDAEVRDTALEDAAQAVDPRGLAISDAVGMRFREFLRGRKAGAA